MISFSFPAGSQGKESATITAYISTTAAIAEGFINLVKEKTGVEIKWRFLSCGEINAKLKAEAPNFNADMGIFVCAPETSMAKKNGWLVRYDSPAWKRVPREWGLINENVFIDPDNEWYNTNVYGFCLGGNKDKLAKAGYTLPTSWKELLDPKWKDQIVMPSPLSSGTAYLMLYSFMTAFGFNEGKGEQGGWEFYEALDKNIHHYTRSGGAPTQLVGRGEFMLGIVSDQNSLPLQQQGYPLVVGVPKEGIGYEAIYAFILKGAKNVSTCQKVIDFLSTDEFSKYMADIGYVTRLPNYPSALYKGIPNYIPNVNHTWAIENKTRLVNEWKDRFLRK